MSIQDLKPEQARHLFKVWDGEKMWGPENLISTFDGGNHFLARYDSEGMETEIHKGIMLDCIARKDGQGNWIFEGDAVRWRYGIKDSELLIAKWQNNILDLFRPKFNTQFASKKVDVLDLEIIGSIYVNPRLEVQNG